MIYSVTPNLVKTAEPCEDGSFDVRICAPLLLFIKIFEVAHTHELVVIEQKAQLTIGLRDISIGPVCLNGLKC